MLFLGKQKGFISILITLGVFLIALAIPVTVKLVEQRQEIRSRAMQADDGGGGGGGSEEAAPEIQAGIPLGGNMVVYGQPSPVYGEYPSKADVALDKELEGISDAALFVAGTSLAGGGMVAAAPALIPAAIETAVAIAPTVQTVGVASTKIGMGMTGAGITGQVGTGLYRAFTEQERETSPGIINMIDDASRFSQEAGGFLLTAGPVMAWSGAAVRATYSPPTTYYHYTTTENSAAIAEEGFNVKTFSGQQQTTQILKNITKNPSGVRELLHVNNFEGASVYVTDVPPNKASAVPASFLGRMDDAMNRMLRNSSSFGLSNPKQLEAYFTVEPQEAGLVKQTLSNWILGVPEWKIPTTNLPLTDPRFKIGGPFYR